jgi:presenilin-like A22 family membrane protease
MKHDWRTTLQLLGWSVAGVGLSLIFYGRLRDDVVPDVSQNAMVGIIIAAVLFGALLWWMILKFKRIIPLDGAIAAAIAIASGDVSGAIGGSVLTRVGVMFGTFVVYIWCVRYMQQSWKNTEDWMWLANLIFLFVVAGAGAILGRWLSPFLAIVVLGILAVYDAFAVWVSKHMLEFANGFIEKRAFPGFAIPKKEGGKFGIIGGGDIFMMAMVSCAFYGANHAQGVVMICILMIALSLLFLLSDEKKSYPALPYLFIGGAIAYIVMVIV